jgi:hypothetical protein
MGMYRGQRGQVLPLVAICLAVLMGFAAMAIDVGFLEYRQRQQQNATDAAAIGGAQALGYVGCVNQSSVAQTAGNGDAASNGFANGGNGGTISVQINNPPASGPYAGNTCAVQAVINNSNTQTFFSRIFGFTNVGETTQAVAVTSNSAPLCMVQLSPTGSPTFDGNKTSAAGCSLEMNGSPVFHGGTIDFSYIGYAGSLTDHGTKWTEASPAPMLPVADPCPEIAGCRELLDNPPSTSNCTSVTLSNGVLTPGCYSNATGFTSMEPGLYVFTGTASPGSSLTGTGVTIYVANGGSFPLGGATANLTPCTTSCGGPSGYQAAPDVLYFQPASNTAGVTISGPPFTISGLIYAPGATLTINGNGGSGYSLLVFADWKINGTGNGMTFVPPPPGGGFVAQAILVQ